MAGKICKCSGEYLAKLGCQTLDKGERMSEGFLIKQEKYLESGIHIGTKIRTIDMQRFIFKKRTDGLYVLDLRSIDERIRIAAKIISKYDPKKVYVVASRTYSTIAAKIFGRLTTINVLSGRFIPGRFTNVGRKDFAEPDLVIICDPKGEKQAVIECGQMGIPTIGLCDTDNFTQYIDWIIPCNNKGRKSLALIFWLLSRELAMTSEKINSYEQFRPDIDEFEKLTSEFLEEQKTKIKKEEIEDDQQLQNVKEEKEPTPNQEQKKDEQNLQPAAQTNKNLTKKDKTAQQKNEKKENKMSE